MSEREPGTATPAAHDPADNHPDLAELRSVGQPRAHMARYNAEHWTGALYIRHLSIHLTRWLLPTGVSPNGVTWLMILAGLLGSCCLALPLPGVAGPLLAAVAMQLQILLDCSDGELARWRQRFSPAGIYLDRVGHYLTEGTLPLALGLRAGGWTPGHPLAVGGWSYLGALVALIVVLNKAFTDLVHVARAKTGRPMLDDVAATARPKAAGLATVRRIFTVLPVFRAFVAVEFTLLALAAGIVDAVRADLTATHVLLLVLLPLAVVTAAGHLLGVLTSSRLD